MAWRPPGAHDNWGQLEMDPLAGARRSDRRFARAAPWTRLCWAHVWILLYCFEAAGGDSVLPVANLETECVQGPLEHLVGAILERCKRRHMPVPADQHIGS